MRGPDSTKRTPWRWAGRRARTRSARPGRAAGSWPSRRRAIAAWSTRPGRPGWPRSAAASRSRDATVSESVISGRDAGHHAVPLILRVGGVAQALAERVAGVLQRPHQRRVIRHVQTSRAGTGSGPGSARDRARRRSDSSSRSAPNTDRTASATTSSASGDAVDEPRRPCRRGCASKRRGERVGAGARRAGSRARRRPPRRARRSRRFSKKAGSCRAHRVDHRADHHARLVRACPPACAIRSSR